MPRGMNLPTRAHIYPEQYGLRIQRDPEASDPKALELVIYNGARLEQIHLALSEEMKTHLHDATGPGLYVERAMPDTPPPQGG